MALTDLFRARRTVPVIGRQADTAPQSLFDRLSRTAERKIDARDNRGPQGAARHLLGEAVLQRRALIVAPADSAIHEHANWLAEHMRGVRLHPTLTAAVHDAWLACDDTVLVIDADMFRDMNEAVDVLMPFRREHPDQVIVIASRSFAAHDFSCERAVIADASLRLPLTGPQLALGLGAAISNHASIRRRGWPV